MQKIALVLVSLLALHCSEPTSTQQEPPNCYQEAAYLADLLVVGVSASPMAWTSEDRRSYDPPTLERKGPYSAEVFQDAVARRSYGYNHVLDPPSDRDMEVARRAMSESFLVFDIARDNAALALYDCLDRATEVPAR